MFLSAFCRFQSSGFCTKGTQPFAPELSLLPFLRLCSTTLQVADYSRICACEAWKAMSCADRKVESKRGTVAQLMQRKQLLALSTTFVDLLKNWFVIPSPHRGVEYLRYFPGGCASKVGLHQRRCCRLLLGETQPSVVVFLAPRLMPRQPDSGLWRETMRW